MFVFGFVCLLCLLYIRLFCFAFRLCWGYWLLGWVALLVICDWFDLLFSCCCLLWFVLFALLFVVCLLVCFRSGVVIVLVLDLLLLGIVY